ncbi:MAG TPA: plastocyanin/azurin family copper-binding protein [Candidatus Binatia bacterium]|nr:plastocyanin/azurin family copper-binding protein [Candidatus Binatia bacterium]
MLQIDIRQARRAPVLAAMAGTALVLAACSAATPTPAASSDASEPAGTARCAVQADADPAATMAISGSAFGDEITIAAGEAVEFTNEDSVGHTVTEGTGGVADADACVDESIAGGASVVVRFDEPGDYQITCRIHSSMQTAIHVE